jgi:hypothetical protein
MPIANFCNYASSFVEFQNCIAIDSNDDFYTNFEGVYGGFYIRKSNDIGGITYSSTNTSLRGSIVLNVKHDRWGTGSPSEALAIGYGASNLLFENCIFWNMNNGMVIDNGLTANYAVKNCTFGITSPSGSYRDMLLGNNAYGDVSNSIFYKIGGIALNDVKSSTKNSFYLNGSDKNSVSTSSGDIIDINPIWQTSSSNGGLKYLVRLESDGALKKAGTNGADIGATVLKKIGTTGTLWGESGYNITSSEDLWPWPQEDVIAKAFRTGVSTPSSTRGFCASNQTLTKYIWEYLGNTMPVDLGDSSSATPQPQLSAPMNINIVQ